MLKKQTSDYRQLIREAAELIQQKVDENNKIIENSDYSEDVISIFYGLDVLYTNIMAREHERNSIKWEAALITVMESSLIVFSGYEFRYIEPNIADCEFRYKYFKKLISQKRDPVIKIFTGGRLARYRGRWYCYSIWN